MAAAEVGVRLLDLLELARPDLVEADGRDESGVGPEELVQLLEDPLRLQRHLVEVHLATEAPLVVGGLPRPVAGRTRGRHLFGHPRQGFHGQLGVGHDAEIGGEDLADDCRLDVDVDEFALTPVDGQIAGVPLGEPIADGQDQVGLQEQLVAGPGVGL